MEVVQGDKNLLDMTRMTLVVVASACTIMYKIISNELDELYAKYMSPRVRKVPVKCYFVVV